MREIHIFNIPDDEAITLVDEFGTPIEPDEGEPTLEASLTVARADRFVAKHLNIIELLQTQLLEGVESGADPEKLYTLSEALKTNMQIATMAEEVFLGS